MRRLRSGDRSSHGVAAVGGGRRLERRRDFFVIGTFLVHDYRESMSALYVEPGGGAGAVAGLCGFLVLFFA